jgi:hypothetical protein
MSFIKYQFPIRNKKYKPIPLTNNKIIIIIISAIGTAIDRLAWSVLVSNNNMLNFFKTLFKKKKKKTEHELFLEFLRTAKDKMVSEQEKAMFRYLEEIYNFAVKSQEEKIEKKKTKVSTWVSQDLEIDQELRRKKEEEENKLPHPTKQNA